MVKKTEKAKIRNSLGSYVKVKSGTEEIEINNDIDDKPIEEDEKEFVPFKGAHLITWSMKHLGLHQLITMR